MPDEDPKSPRLFVAIELPDAVKQQLQAAADALRAAGAGDAVRWTRPEGIHVTLKFLGAVAQDRVPALHSALRLAVRDASPFTLQPGAQASFGGRRNLRVIWVSVDIVDGGDALAALAGRVESSLAPLGFEREGRPFAAHLTLGRVRDDTPPDERARLYDLLAAIAPPPFEAFRVESVSLMRSTLGRGGAVYDAIGAYPLEGGAP